jgi:hypothetical protein
MLSAINMSMIKSPEGLVIMAEEHLSRELAIGIWFHDLRDEGLQRWKVWKRDVKGCVHGSSSSSGAASHCNFGLTKSASVASPRLCQYTGLVHGGPYTKP